MKPNILHLIYICIFLGTSLLLTGCCEKEDTWDQPKKELDRTLIIYMAGENSLSRFVSEDSTEIANGLTSLPEGCRVIMYIDDAKSSRLCVGTAEHPMETVKIYPRNICSTDSADMELVLKEIFKRYPAKSYGLVMWSHASGWVFEQGSKISSSIQRAPRRSFGIDNGQRSPFSNTGLRMDITTLTRVLSHHPHLDFVMFDACFMQCIEVAYELKDVADWVMGSPAEIPGSGAPYDMLLPMLGSKEALPNLSLQVYYDYYESGPGHWDPRTREGYYGAVLSAIKTAELPALVQATAPLLQRILQERNLLDCSDVQRYSALNESIHFTEFYDMANVFHSHLPQDDYNRWAEAMERAVPYRYMSQQWTSAYTNRPMEVADTEHCAAVSMFVPTEFYDTPEWMNKYHQLQWYNAVGMSATGW